LLLLPANTTPAAAAAAAAFVSLPPLSPAAYAAGFFHSISSMAYASDYILDLIPCDTGETARSAL
jgi:hypothetical protein